MLQVTVFALLATGCMCIAPYNSKSTEKYNSYIGKKEIPMPKCSPEENELAFTVNRQSDVVLVFEPKKGGILRCGKENAQLVSIVLVFYSKFHPEIRIKLKSLDGDSDKEKLWVVTSQLFSTPKTPADTSLAEEDAVILSSENEHFVTELENQRGESKKRNTALSLDWIRTVFQTKQLRFAGYAPAPSDAWNIYLYAGPPLVITSKAFQALDNVRKAMEVPKIQDVVYPAIEDD